MKDKFRYNAELTIKSIKQEAGITLDYDESSVAWLEGYIEEQRNRLDPDSAQMLISVLGSFLGECIRKQFGGEWVERAEGWAICFDEANCVFPFNKLRKQFAEGRQESILSFYQTIPIVFKRKASRDRNLES